MKIFSLIDVGYIFFNLWYGSMWRVVSLSRNTHCQYYAVSYRPSVERLNQAPYFTSGFLVASKQYGGLCVLSNLSLCLYVLIWIHILFPLQFCIFIHNGKHGCFNEGAKARTKALSTFKQAPRYIWGKYKTLL